MDGNRIAGKGPASRHPLSGFCRYSWSLDLWSLVANRVVVLRPSNDESINISKTNIQNKKPISHYVCTDFL